MRRTVLRMDGQEAVRITEDAQGISLMVTLDSYNWREIKVSEQVLLMFNDCICEFLASKS